MRCLGSCSIFILLSCHPGNKEPACFFAEISVILSIRRLKGNPPRARLVRMANQGQSQGVELASRAKGSGWNVSWVMGADATQRLEVTETSGGVWRWRKVDGVCRGTGRSIRLLVCCSGYTGIIALDTSFQSGCLEGLMCLLLVS